MKTDALLIELGCEEFPHDLLESGKQQLFLAVTNVLKSMNVAYGKAQSFHTPKRLVLYLEDVVLEMPAREIVRHGPSYDTTPSEALKKAWHGFSSAIIADAKVNGEVLVGVIDGNLNFTELQEKPEGKAKAGFYRGKKKGKENIVFYRYQQESKTAKTIAPLIGVAITKMRFPETMVWGTSTESFPRPVRNIVGLLGSELLQFSAFGLSCGRKTFPNRFIDARNDETNASPVHPLGGKPIEIVDAKSYFPLMEKAQVEIDEAQRSQSILQQLAQLERKYDCSVEKSVKQKLTTLNAALVEKPFVFSAQFEQEYLKVPNEILESEMIEHQKYFPTYKNGKLSNRFIAVANVPTTAEIVAGNRAVLSARLADGAFLYDADLRGGISQMMARLGKITFYAGMGNNFNYLEKSLSLIDRLFHSDRYFDETSKTSQHKNANVTLVVKRILATVLMKVDLASEVVKEFPHLQGIMGSYYIQATGRHKKSHELKNNLLPLLGSIKKRINEHENDEEGKRCGYLLKRLDALTIEDWDEIAQAVREQYTTVGAIAGISNLAHSLIFYEQIQDLTFLFCSGVRPTGSEDTMGLRRKATMVCEIMLNYDYPLSYSWALSDTIRELFVKECSTYTILRIGYGEDLKNKPKETALQKVAEELQEGMQALGPFIVVRLKGLLSKRFNRVLVAALSPEYEIFDLKRKDTSVSFHCSFPKLNPKLSVNRLQQLQRFFLTSPSEARQYSLAIKRITNILRKSSVNGDNRSSGGEAAAGLSVEGALPVSTDLFEENAEKKLWEKTKNIFENLKNDEHKNQFLETIGLTKLLDSFFEEVMVNVDDKVLRGNRLALLQAVRFVMSQGFDWDKIPESEITNAQK